MIAFGNNLLILLYHTKLLHFMKKTINQLANWHYMPLKLVGTLLLITFFSSVFGQINDPPGFDVEKARKELVERGISSDKIEGELKKYIEKSRDNYRKYQNLKENGGVTKTIPAKSIIKKSGNGNCVGDFENGNVSPWSGFTSTNYGLNTFISNTATFSSGIINGRHTIVSPGSDPHVGSINKVHSGSYALRLGNDSISNTYGGYAERVSQTVTVTGSCLSFYYALVFQNGHNSSPNDQPFFMFRLLDSAGNLLDSFVKSASYNPFYTQYINEIVYRNWTEYTVELGCEYVGKTVTIEFTNADCTQGGHYGYTYIDDVCFENCMSCCSNCEDLLRYPGMMSNYPVITKLNSTDSTCCFKFNFIFDPDIFGCDPYGVKVYKEGDTSVVYSSYSNDSGLVYEKPLYNPSMLNFCLNKSTFTSTTVVRVAFYDKNGNKICDTIRQVLKPCCENCEDLINLPELYTTYPIIQFRGSTDSSCCYKFSLPIFVAQAFKCSPYGVKVYETANPSVVYSSYQGYALDKGGFNPSVMDFCVGRSGFTSPKTLTIAFYDSLGNLICDSITRVIEPCHSTSSGCNCNSLFENSNFANTSIVKKDTAASDEYNCCFTLEPFRDSTIIKCPYYGIRVYKDSAANSAWDMYADTVSNKPMGGKGAKMSDTGKIRFCIGAYQFADGPKTFRIEYLDSSGKAICSKTEKVNCEQSCCDNVTINVIKDTTETDPHSCCITIVGHLGNCFTSKSIELMEYTDSGWVTVSVRLASPMGMFVFANLCRPADDTTRYMIFIKDSTGKVLCSKEVIQICGSCCDLVSYTATYVPPSQPAYLDRCCWDINVYPTANAECNIWYWQVYDSLHKVPSSYPTFLPPSIVYQGRHCTPVIHAPNPAPGTSITIKYCIKRYLAVYDNNGNLLCIKPIELCCTRTYSNPHNPNGPLNIDIIPNPFNDVFTMSMDLQQAMPVAVNVVNSSGSTVFSNNYGPQPTGVFSTQINLAGLPAGTYTLSVNNGQATAQIVKQ